MQAVAPLEGAPAAPQPGEVVAIVHIAGDTGFVWDAVGAFMRRRSHAAPSAAHPADAPTLQPRDGCASPAAWWARWWARWPASASKTRSTACRCS
jgi:hypothetical protein